MKRMMISPSFIVLAVAMAALGCGIAGSPARADENVFVFSAPVLDVCDPAHQSLSVTVRNTTALATMAMATAPMTLAVREGALSGQIAIPQIAPAASQTITIPLVGAPTANDSLTTLSVLGAQNGMPSAILEVAGLAFQRKICPSLGHLSATKPDTK